MLLVVVIGVLLGWMIHKAREQGIAVAALKEKGCLVSEGFDNAPLTAVERLRKLLGEHEPKNVRLVSRGAYKSLPLIDDACMARLPGLPQLQCLFFDGTQVTDAGLAHLRGLPELRELSLDDTLITDAGLVHLQGLSSLRDFHISGTQVTDAGVQRLQNALPNCKITHNRVGTR